MAETYKLQFADDWGSFNDGTKDRPATGQEVQEFIKSQLQTISDNSIGYFYGMDDPDTTKNRSIMLGFKDLETCESWKATADLGSPLILSTAYLNKSLPEPYFVASIQSETPTNYISLDNSVVLKFRFAYNKFTPGEDGMISEPVDKEGRLLIERRTTSNWETAYEAKIEANKVNENGVLWETVDLTDKCTDGSQEVRVTISSLDGDIEPFSTSIRYNVTKTEVSVIYAKDGSQAQTGKSMSLAFGILGSVDKKLHVEILGPGGKNPRKIVREIGKNTYNIGLGATAYSFNVTDTATDTYKVLTHGVHTIKAWLEIIETGQMVAHTQFQIMMRINMEDPTPYLLLNNLNTTPVNWSAEQLFDYSIFDPFKSQRELTVVLKDYNNDTEYLKLGPEIVATNQPFVTYSNTLEIENSDNPFYAQMIFMLDGEEIIDPIQFAVQNSGEYGPTPGAHFIFDPKSRSNNEINNEVIYNKVTGEEIPSVWNGFNHNNDAWVEEKSERRLRVLSGQTLSIDYNPYYSDGLDKWVDNSCTIEMVLAVNNIINPENPVMGICDYYDNGNFNGIEIKPNSAAIMTPEQNIYKNQDIVFQEGVKTHIAFNIINNIYSYKDQDGKTGSINLVRIFVNGRINREFAYKNSDILTDNTNTVNPRSIILGNINDSADLDIYSIRVYKNKLDTNAIFNDYISSLSTSEEKDLEKAANDIMQDGKINYDLARSKYNTLLWRPCEREGAPETTNVASKLNDGKFQGDLVISVLNKDKDGKMVEDTKRSGILKDAQVKGQGTSSMTYWKWNQRWEFDKIKTGKKDEKGEDICYETLFYANDGSEPVGSWLVEEGCPRAKRIDGKINWASPMQSHKLGSTALYHDLWKEVVGNNAITSRADGQSFTGTDNGYADCRVAIKQLPFLLFEQKEIGGSIEFVGLYTVGASKGDKPTFGYNKKDDHIKPFIMMEGCDNGAALVTHRIPWNHDDITADLTDGIVFMYNKVKQWEVSMGDDSFDVIFNDGEQLNDKVTAAKNSFKSKQLELFRQMNNFNYLINPDIHPFVYQSQSGEVVGTNINDPEQTAKLNNQAFYWMVSNNPVHGSRYDLYRYHEVLKKWVNAGVNRVTLDGVVQDEYEVLNLAEQCKEYYIPAGGSYNTINQEFINARVKIFADGIGQFVYTNDLQYTMQFLKLIAASDNWAKNTYLYSTGWNKDWTKDSGKDTLEYVEKFRFFQDDLDTIFASNNTGQKTKPYYIEEHDLDENGSPYWNASTNGMYCAAELAWPHELRATMYNILQAMKNLGGSVEGCFDKYYNDVQKYFPATCYNEIARILYEDAKINKDAGIYEGIEPLSQCLGDQLQAEKYWQNARIPYLSSYAMHGEFEAADGAAYTSGAFNFRSTLVDGSQHEYKFKLTPYTWLYPSIGVGQSSYTGTDNELPMRVRAGESFEFPKFTTDGNTNIFVRGINNYIDVDDFGNVATALTTEGKNITVSGNRLTSFNVTERDTAKGILFRPEQLTFATNMKNLSRIVIKGSAYQSDIVTGGLDLSSLWRLRYVDLTGTKAISVTLPENSNIDTLYLPSTLRKLELKNLKMLAQENFEMKSYKNLTSLTIIGCEKIDSRLIFNKCFEADAKLESINISGIDWIDVTTNQLIYLLGVPSLSISGKITMIEGDAGLIDFDTKMKLLDKFGDIDNSSNDLYIVYERKYLSNQAGVSIKGSNSIHKNGKYQFSLNYMSGEYSANDFSNIAWSVSRSVFGDIDAKSGVFTFTDVPSIQDKDERIIDVICNITRVNSGGGINTFSVKKSIFLYQLPANVGDYVYADGSYSSPADDMGDKTVVAVCFYAEPDVEPESQKRLAVAVETATPSNKAISWGLRDNYNNTSADVVGLSNFGYSGVYGTSSEYNFYIGSESARQIINDFNSPEFKSKYGSTAAGDIGWANDINRGKSNTTTIISHRDAILTKNNMANPSNWNTESRKSEYDYLSYILNAVRNTGARFAYYPAISYCYAYEPGIKENGIKLKNGEVLSDKFKAHNWHAPSFGEMVHLWYYLTNLEDIEENELVGFDNIFGKSINGLNGNSTYLWCSTEGGSYWAYAANVVVGSCQDQYISTSSFSNGKANEDLCNVLPIVSF